MEEKSNARKIIEMAQEAYREEPWFKEDTGVILK